MTSEPNYSQFSAPKMFFCEMRPGGISILATKDDKSKWVLLANPSSFLNPPYPQVRITFSVTVSRCSCCRQQREEPTGVDEELVGDSRVVHVMDGTGKQSSHDLQVCEHRLGSTENFNFTAQCQARIALQCHLPMIYNMITPLRSFKDVTLGVILSEKFLISTHYTVT